MCTSGENGRGSCQGDSGGPALVKDKDGSFVQVGIVSFGAYNGCEEGFPSSQTLVHKFIDWIEHITGLHI
jgi:secreted trypsin-like serine protease